MKHLLLLLCVALPVSASAADWSLRATDRPFSAEELADLPGRSLVFFDDGETIYGADGAYSYTYSTANGGGTAWGTYQIAEDGSICVEFASGAMRCDVLVHSGERVILITEKGERFPIR
ncbi:hypothetical protein KMP13_05520 [Epibacterium ulvae]|uniref:hypothetical protein n=1 Tax=Epibacterium ulvae TaxID=1156985 RepID=UPI001BFC1033|nr:hypothetical protein [Epibacterium ulvae]MBT8153358.1 hypothetical protein [Epibacterium ulvae]